MKACIIKPLIVISLSLFYYSVFAADTKLQCSNPEMSITLHAKKPATDVNGDPQPSKPSQRCISVNGTNVLVSSGTNYPPPPLPCKNREIKITFIQCRPDSMTAVHWTCTCANDSCSWERMTTRNPCDQR